LNRVYLLPGQWAFPTEASEITTVLGPCVAVCLHDRGRRAGGMNHFLLPSGAALRERGRFGDLATEDLVQALLGTGSAPGSLVALIVGGAHINSPDAPDSLGRRNAAAARGVLDRFGVRIEHSDIGGPAARRLKFNTETGVLETKRIEPVALPGLAPVPARVAP
jgi:chemotaxis receptor (MCP) glutamine deamidase CheD